MITKIQDFEMVRIAKDYVMDSEYAPRIIEAYENGNRLSVLFKSLLEDLKEQGIACNDCGNIPETGACFYCKMD